MDMEIDIVDLFLVGCFRVGLVGVGRDVVDVVDVGFIGRERGLVGRDVGCFLVVLVMGLFGEDAV
jgi:hypothetical protein